MLGSLCFFIQKSERACFEKNFPFIGILQAPNLDGMKTKLTSMTLFCQLRSEMYLKEVFFSFSSLNHNQYKPSYMLDSRGKSMSKITLPKGNSKLRSKSSLKTWIRDLARSSYIYSRIPASYVTTVLFRTD